MVQAGKIKTVQLSERVTTGRQQWLQWHADFADRLPAQIKASALSRCVGACACVRNGAAQAWAATGSCMVADMHRPLPSTQVLRGWQRLKVSTRCPGLKPPLQADRPPAIWLTGHQHEAGMQADEAMAAEVASLVKKGGANSVRVVSVATKMSALELWEPLCEDPSKITAQPLLLLPPEFKLLEGEQGLKEMAELMLIGDKVPLPGCDVCLQVSCVGSGVR